MCIQSSIGGTPRFQSGVFMESGTRCPSGCAPRALVASLGIMKRLRHRTETLDRRQVHPDSWLSSFAPIATWPQPGSLAGRSSVEPDQQRSSPTFPTDDKAYPGNSRARQQSCLQTHRPGAAVPTCRTRCDFAGGGWTSLMVDREVPAGLPRFTGDVGTGVPRRRGVSLAGGPVDDSF